MLHDMTMAMSSPTIEQLKAPMTIFRPDVMT